MNEKFFEAINPAELVAPRGYNNGMLAGGAGRLLFVAGQIGWDLDRRLSDRFSEQFEQALRNILAVVRAAGGGPEHIGKLTIFVTSKQEYIEQIREVGEGYRRVMGKHFPAMALIEISSLLEAAAKVEIEAMAVVP